MLPVLEDGKGLSIVLPASQYHNVAQDVKGKYNKRSGTRGLQGRRRTLIEEGGY
jgi:hypothetical protein